MREIVLIGNASSANGPGKVLNSLYNELRKNNKDVKLISTDVGFCGKIIVFAKVCRLLFKRNKIINVHSFGYKIPNLIRLISKVNKRNDYFLTLHGIASIEGKINGDKYKGGEEYKLVKGFPNIICVSDFERKQIASYFGRQKDVVVIYNGADRLIDKKKKIKNKKKYIITMVGAFCRRKNALSVLAFASFAKEHGLQVEINICGGEGKSEYHNLCKEYIANHELSDFVNEVGVLDGASLAELYLKSDYIMALSKFDTFNLSVLEAMQYGIPAIVSKCCGVSEIVEDSGIVVGDDDYSSILDFIENSDYNYVSGKAYEIGQKYTVEEMTKHYIQLFGEC